MKNRGLREMAEELQNHSSWGCTFWVTHLGHINNYTEALGFALQWCKSQLWIAEDIFLKNDIMHTWIKLNGNRPPKNRNFRLWMNDVSCKNCNIWFRCMCLWGGRAKGFNGVLRFIERDVWKLARTQAINISILSEFDLSERQSADNQKHSWMMS